MSKKNNLEPRTALNKAYLKVKPERNHIETFKTNLIAALDQVNLSESEEFHKNIMMDFFKKTYYDPGFYINTKGRNDWVIHNGKDAASNVGVIIETKSPKNKSEMISTGRINCKALQELVLYYLRERITGKNNDIRHLVVTNVYEWFLFDAQHFDKLFAQDREFVRRFKESESKISSNSSTNAFYKEVAAPFIDSIAGTLEYTFIDIRRFEKPLRNNDKHDDRELIALYKIFSPEHLLKLSFANDSNSLDKNFYTELLHIIGLVETKEGGKKIIGRQKPGQRHPASLLENAIEQIDSLDKLSRLENVRQFGENKEERLFNVALELTITWLNRILFLKLLEAQLLAYHQGEKTYSFLNAEKLKDYDGLNSLFFKVLAKRQEERSADIKKLYSHVPYLNSSLFEPTDLEHKIIFISQLEGYEKLPLLSNTVIKDNSGKKLSGTMDALQYLFEFLEAYDFASEGSEDIQEDNKTLINASVLGLIFEKINGYRDGSFFTPGFITMYMCRETIRRAVVKRFNEIKGWDVTEFHQLFNRIGDIEEANYIVNSLRICDPAVGSGHFLVSALNEIIAIKGELHILADRQGRRIKDYFFDVVNDELMVTDEMGRPFRYNPLSRESQRIQEMLFHEKETIIENCLFGVDINPNSAKICRLRLWIELLKNAYYVSDPASPGRPGTELETLPNIDINIKTGNSLVSRFPLDADLKKALKDSKWNMERYKSAVVSYRNADSKEHKREMEALINDIKGNFRTEISNGDPKAKRLYALRGQLQIMRSQTDLFEKSKKDQAALAKKQTALQDEAKKLDAAIEEIKNNKIYENAFEWRFEFPEVLDDAGNFIGFSAIIGNPPYIQLQKMGAAGTAFQKMSFETYNKTGDIYSLFYEHGFNILKEGGVLSFITSNKWMRAAYGESLRKYFVEKTNPIVLADFGGVQVFDTATVDTNILIGEKAPYSGMTNACIFGKNFSINNISDYIRQQSIPTAFATAGWVVLSSTEQEIKKKVENAGTPLREWDIKINRGILTGYNEAFIIDRATRDKLVASSPKSAEIIRPILRGRDVVKYGVNFGGQFLLNIHNGIKSKNEKRIDVLENYPEIYDYLKGFLPGIEARGDKGDHWTNLRNCAYRDDFDKQKIIFPNMTKFLPFFYDAGGEYYTNQKCFIITGNNIEYLTAFLNSSLFKFCFKENFPELQGGTRELSKVFFDKIPVKPVSEIQNSQFEKLIAEAHLLKKQKIDTKAIEKEIDNLIFRLYDLSIEECNTIGFIEIK